MQISIAHNSKLHILLVLGVILLATTLLRIRLLDVPLERDEGEYAYMGQLILDGVPPYAQAYNMKFPGIYFVYAAMLSVLGKTHTAIHVGLLLFNITSIILLYFLGRNALDNWAGVAAAAAYAILSLSYHAQGLWANAEHFLLPFALAGFLILRSAIKNKSFAFLFLSGFLFGCATLVKQHAAFFGLSGFAYLWILLSQDPNESPRGLSRRLTGYVAGGVLPLLTAALYLYHANVFERFYFWAFTYAREYAAQISLSKAPELFLTNFLPILKSTLPLWLIGGVGLIASLSAPAFKKERAFILSFIVGSFFSICTGLFFRPHYFVLFFPAVALLFAVGVRLLFSLFAQANHRGLRLGPPIITATLALLGSLGSHSDVLFQFSPREATRATYGGNPFPEALDVSSFIKERTNEGDRIAILGNEPQILFYTQRRSATGYLYLYPLFEEHSHAASMQQEMIREVETTAPAMMVEVQALPSWYKRSTGEERLQQWFSEYAHAHYRIIGRYEFTPGANTPALVTDTLALQEPSKQIYWISLYKRLTGTH